MARDTDTSTEKAPKKRWDVYDIVERVRRLSTAAGGAAVGREALLEDMHRPRDVRATEALGVLVVQGFLWSPEPGVFLPTDTALGKTRAPRREPLPTLNDVTALAAARGTTGIGHQELTSTFGVEMNMALRLLRDAHSRRAIAKVYEGTYVHPSRVEKVDAEVVRKDRPKPENPLPVEAARTLGLGITDGRLAALGPTESVRDVLSRAWYDQHRKNVDSEPILAALGEIVRWAVRDRGTKHAHELLGISRDTLARWWRHPTIKGGMQLHAGRPRKHDYDLPPMAGPDRA